MTRMTIRRTALATAVLVLAAGAAWAQDTGNADFTKFVALGDSLSAGYTNGGLGEAQQTYSLPALIHARAGSGTFEQPLISEPGIGSAGTKLELTSLVPVTISPIAGAGAPLNLTLPRPYDNLAIPGAGVGDVLYTDCGFPFYDLILRNCGGTRGVGATALIQALSLQPTFASLWVGPNDVLGAAVSGIALDGVTLTPVASFTADYQTLVGQLDAAGVDLVIANIPDVTSIPYVSTVPYFLVDATGTPVVINGQLVPLLGETTTGNRPLTSADRVLLPATAAIAMGQGIPAAAGGADVPLDDSLVLDADEIALIQSRTAALNQVIETAAAGVGAAFVDAHALLGDIALHGVEYGGYSFDGAFLTGGLFSYDGVHPTALGYAITANAFIEAINATYGAHVPLVDLLPFVYDGIGNNGAVLPGALAADAIFTIEARDHLVAEFGVPPVAALSEMHPVDRGTVRPGRVAPKGGKSARLVEER